ncbi:MAG: hypothetical protein HUJ95_06070 [Bacteroidales bacterium]|nr:hypothetical protein [Bacteroidales bacterium]
MKAIFIAYNQAYYLEIADILKEKFGVNGFTLWQNIMGTGSTDGEPHMGSHAWPVQNDSILTIVEDEKVRPILETIEEIDKATPALGLRAFAWSISDMY